MLLRSSLVEMTSDCDDAWQNDTTCPISSRAKRKGKHSLADIMVTVVTCVRATYSLLYRSPYHRVLDRVKFRGVGGGVRIKT